MENERHPCSTVWMADRRFDFGTVWICDFPLCFFFVVCSSVAAAVLSGSYANIARNTLVTRSETTGSTAWNKPETPCPATDLCRGRNELAHT